MTSEVMESRYPGLEFLLSLSDEERNPLGPIESEVSPFSANNLEELETIFIYGLGSGAYFDRLSSWLNGAPVRELIFIEDELSAVSRAKQAGLFDRIFSHPKCHLLVAMPGADLEELAAEAVNHYPSNKVAAFPIESYQLRKGERFDLLREALLKGSVISDALQKETLYHHQLFKNLYANYQRLPDSFFVNRLRGKFKGIPAIICGAGPSLKDSGDMLRELQNRALIFAGGSTIAALNHLQVEPHFAAAIDPNPSEWECLKLNSAHETPILYGSRLLPKVFSSLNGPSGYVQTFSGGGSEHLVEKRLGLLDQNLEEKLDVRGMSVTTMAISAAVSFGCSPIILCGVDMAYTGEKRYSDGVMSDEASQGFAKEVSPRSEEQFFWRKGVGGQEVKTATKWLLESEWISCKAKREEVPFINGSGQGLGVEGVPNITLQQVADTYLESQYDLQGLIRAEIEGAAIGLEKRAVIEELLSELEGSLHRVHKIIGEIIGLLEVEKRLDHPRILVYEMDMKEEMAFKSLLGNILQSISMLASRQSRRLPLDPTEEEKGAYEYDLNIKKYRFMEKVVQEYLQTYESEDPIE